MTNRARKAQIKGKLGEFDKKNYDRPSKRGIGVAYYKSGDKYEGAFLDGKMHGYGELFDVNKSVYKGFWYEGVKHGEGIYIDAKRNIYKQRWVDGLMKK